MQTVTLNIEGMHCGGCVKTVERVLNGLDGVTQVDVNLEHACVTIQYDTNRVSIAQLIDVVENAGFDVQPI
ncbi:TPA: heavy-metal-associated domain-containing protein [Pasteurella multocida]|uniref:heavy-metal-associated domain-containing protein n=1 Tax=Pasteurella multocida TaxID=747 RepID=UPI000233FAEC|nr:heavy-metal-associated domain-containing protein [Pasteurella multocida]AWW60243.1 copper chaperone [Pasteurellaceae bacterium 12591]AET16323.1 ATPase, P-type, K/Mg/Cd/Cu/Zn/Na/Ca/Na/H-transporter family protein [Pasteurella multocida 36950]AHE64822.1 Copper chaperone [Pasteurella multocida subsp. multocida str. HB03]AIN48628.1 copper chaperone CopZ [Pasteurella multocida]ANJ90643.1 ATPase, P-type, K/Mg/Cd/Cu/Zn/Na/Ca/Na/H-transporter family protein [Pasteurella multocida subsp. multocida H